MKSILKVMLTGILVEAILKIGAVAVALVIVMAAPYLVVWKLSEP